MKTGRSQNVRGCAETTTDVGSRHRGHRRVAVRGRRGSPKDFELFHRLCTYTDDTVCTAAIADIIVNERRPDITLQRWCRRHPGRGYGGFFRKWIESAVPAPYGSFGNGAAMRVLSIELDRPVQALPIEALNALFARHGRAQIAE